MNQVQLSPRPQAGPPMIKRCTVMTLFFIVLATSMRGHAADRSSSVTESPQRRDSRMQWWREARFGMFVHWGLYSGLAGTWEGKPVATQGGMEWIQQRVKANTATYAKNAIPLFKPKKTLQVSGLKWQRKLAADTLS